MSSDSEWVEAERSASGQQSAGRERLASERPAAEQLAASGASAEWEQRAEWLEAEAKAHREPAARARLMLAASEVRALLGARADARRLAVQAVNHQPAPAFAVRQARALHQAAGDINAAHRSLLDEARGALDPRLAAHDQYVAAELQRLLQRDAAGARSNFEAAERAHSGDVRATLGRLVLALAQDPAPPESELGGAGVSRELGAAVDAIRRLRGGVAAGARDDLGEHADALALVDVQRALQQARLAEAAAALARLEQRPGSRPAARWLRALWTAAAPERAEHALSAWRELVRELPSRHSRRALAARALGAQSPEAVREALAELAEETAEPAPPGRASRPSFSSSERAALAALVGERLEANGADDPDDASVVGFIDTAVARASSRPPGGSASAPANAESEFELGRAVAALARLSDLWVSPEAAGPWARSLRLEQGREQRDLAALARELPALSAQPLAVAEASFVAAVFSELADDPAAARRAFQASLPSPITREAATRALSESSVEPAPLLRALSAHTTDPLRRALLLTEVLFQLDPAAAEFEALAEEALRTYPELPLASTLGEAAARARAERGRLTRWLERAREHARGRDEQTLATWREVLHQLDVDRPAALARARELCAREGTLAVWLACEPLLELGPSARAEWRRRLAPGLSERGRQRWLAEAVLLHDAAGEPDAALSAARELGGALGELWVARRLTSDDDLDRLARDWAKLAQRTTDVELSAELYARLARLEQRRGRGAQALAWQRERLAIEPASLPALRALEIADMDGSSFEVLEQSENALFDALGERDGLGHAYVATRLAIARGAYDEARPIVRRVNALPSPPLWALRLASAHARDDRDDRALLANYRRLRERSTQALDAATLSLHAAEAALRLGDAAAANDDIQRASELAPDDIVILSVRAEVLSRSGAHAEAAEAFETLASATSSKKRQTEALYQAAVLWLDHLGHRARGMLALQEAAAQDVLHAGLLERLTTLHSQSSDLDGLAELIERQRQLAAERPAESLELSRAVDAIEAGELDEARLIVDALLAQRPADINVLLASAELHVRHGAGSLAEPQFRRVLELSGPGHARSIALAGLSQLYEGELARPEALPPIYEELLAHDPDNGAIRRRLVALLASRRQWLEAAVQQRQVLARAPDEEARKGALLYLVKLLEQGPDGAEESLALLDQARHTWPEDARVLEAEVTHHQSAGDPAAARVIIERALGAARGAIAAGRLDAAPFRTIQAAARLGGDPDTALIAHATGNVVGGAPAPELSGAGAGALDPALDALIAPSWPSAMFRRLLYAAGAAIERAYAPDLDAFVSSPAPDAVSGQLGELARAAGIEPLRALVSADLGVECRCRGGAGLSLVLGAPLVEPQHRRWLEAAVVSELKLAQANASVLARMAPDECWAALAGFFACFGQSWAAAGADAPRVVRALNRLRPHVTWIPEADLAAQLPALSNEVLPRASEVPLALRSWASRCALLAVGDLGVALDASGPVARAPIPLPKDEDGRIRWIAAHPEAHDLVRYGISDAYMQARRRAGLGTRSP